MSAVLRQCFNRCMASKASSGPSVAACDRQGGYKIWKKLSLFVGFPAIVGCMVNCYVSIEHHERPEFVKWQYLRIRTKRFPWGEGVKSLFHNPHTNPLPDGYEDDE